MVSSQLPLRALLVNDASIAGHHGSAIVTLQLGKLAAAAGITVSSGWTWDAVEALLAKEDGPFDLVIVNGEGSIHSDSRTAKRVAKLARQLAGKLPAYLVNATIENNSPEIDRDLGSFRLRFVRDSDSKGYLSKSDIAADVVHDLTLTASHLASHAAGHGVLLVTDASDDDKTLRLLALGKRWQAEPMTLRARPPKPVHGSQSRALKFNIKRQVSRFVPLSPWSLRYGGALDMDAFIDKMNQGNLGIVSGRYHAVCLAIRMGIPFVAISGNTGKTEALLADVGLAHRATTLEELERKAGPMIVPPYSEVEKDKIASFLAAVETKAADMFRRISDDAQINSRKA